MVTTRASAKRRPPSAAPTPPHIRSPPPKRHKPSTRPASAPPEQPPQFDLAARSRDQENVLSTAVLALAVRRARNQKRSSTSRSTTTSAPGSGRSTPLGEKSNMAGRGHGQDDMQGWRPVARGSLSDAEWEAEQERREGWWAMPPEERAMVEARMRDEGAASLDFTPGSAPPPTSPVARHHPATQYSSASAQHGLGLVHSGGSLHPALLAQQGDFAGHVLVEAPHPGGGQPVVTPRTLHLLPRGVQPVYVQPSTRQQRPSQVGAGSGAPVPQAVLAQQQEQFSTLSLHASSGPASHPHPHAYAPPPSDHSWHLSSPEATLATSAGPSHQYYHGGQPIVEYAHPDDPQQYFDEPQADSTGAFAAEMRYQSAIEQAQRAASLVSSLAHQHQHPREQYRPAASSNFEHQPSAAYGSPLSPETGALPFADPHGHGYRDVYAPSSYPPYAAYSSAFSPEFEPSSFPPAGHAVAFSPQQSHPSPIQHQQGVYHGVSPPVGSSSRALRSPRLSHSVRPSSPYDPRPPRQSTSSAPPRRYTPYVVPASDLPTGWKHLSERVTDEPYDDPDPPRRTYVPPPLPARERPFEPYYGRRMSQVVQQAAERGDRDPELDEELAVQPAQVEPSPVHPQPVEGEGEAGEGAAPPIAPGMTKSLSSLEMPPPPVPSRSQRTRATSLTSSRRSTGSTRVPAPPTPTTSRPATAPVPDAFAVAAPGSVSPMLANLVHAGPSFDPFATLTPFPGGGESSESAGRSCADSISSAGGGAGGAWQRGEGFAQHGSPRVMDTSSSLEGWNVHVSRQ
ncbi:hypothetical protein JCM10207_000914 [Rhodosporidiobolus poonsookiae]